MGGIQVSPAGAEAREQCYRLAYEIFCEEMGALRESADHGLRMVRDAAIEKAHLLCARIDGELAGAMGILIGTEQPFPDHFEHGFDIARFLGVVPRSRMALNIRFLVRPQFRGTPVPFRLMLESQNYQIRQGIVLSFCDCQPHLLGLYQSLGFRPCAPLFEQPGFGMMAPLLFCLADYGHLRSIQSPLLRYYPKALDNPELAARISALLPEKSAVTGAARPDEEAWLETFELLCRSNRQTGAFAGFTEKELNTFLDKSQVLECSEGQRVILEGQGTKNAFIVLQGCVEARRNGSPVAIFREGEMFGEFAFLLEMKRTADVFAVSPQVRLLVLNERTLQRVLATDAAVASKFLLNLSKSLALRLIQQSR
jgi:GNAT superfamily N-acetyltransferase